MSTLAPRCRRARPLLGTLVDIEARGAAAQAAVAAGFEAVARVHRLMTRHDADSDIGRFNAAPVGALVRMDAGTLEVLDLAAELQSSSDGAFDCSRGFGECEPCGACAWTREGDAVRKNKPVQLDLGGIAKGYAVDCAIEAMCALAARHGSHDALSYALVNAGGDLRHAGAEPAQVALREPGSSADLAMTWALDNAALASSVVGGLAPEPGQAPRIAGRAADASLPPGAGASVLAPRCMLADALTKVVLVSRAPSHPLLAHYRARTLLYRDGTSACPRLPHV
jgi:thiamine biosynthesis lipoprotein